MNNTSSPFFPEIYLQLENTKILNIFVQNRIIGYFQCVNILIVYLHNARNIQEFLNLPNNLNLTMNFTMQEEYENTINFLDITIS